MGVSAVALGEGLTPFTEEAGDDAVRDALALVRAAVTDDRAAAVLVAANLPSPRLTAVILAYWLASFNEAVPADELLARLAAWQHEMGLG